MKSEETGLHLAFIGAVRDAVVDTTELSLELITFLRTCRPGTLLARYGVEETGTPLEMLERIAGKRGFIRKGGEADLDKAALALIDDFRKLRLGKIILEMPDDE